MMSVRILALCLALPVAAPAVAQPAAPEDWPCVQVLVPEIMAGVFWPRPLEPTETDLRKRDRQAATLGRRLAGPEPFDDTTVAAIDEFVSGVPQAALAGRLDAVAEHTIALVNEHRTQYIDGIRRYTRQQIAIAGQIESTLNELAALDDSEADSSESGSDETGNPAAPAVDRAAIEQTLVWHERLYDQRERAIRALCDQPVQLEQTLSSALRELAGRLPTS